MTPLSIVVTFYDETAYLRMAVNSVLAQGIDGVELIVVNDNPERFGPETFARLGLPAAVRILHHPANRGLSAARNTGIAAATGALIGFLDADDYYVSGGLAAQLDEARRSGADITHAPCYVGRPRSPEVQLLRRDRLLLMTPKHAAGLTGAEEAQFITSSWSSLYRADFLKRAGLAFDVEQSKFEDRLFVLQAVTAAGRIAFTGRPNRVWRSRSGSISRSASDPWIERLKVQLLEKCMAHMRHQTGTGRLAPRFFKRELFNTVSRAIWDMDLIAAVAAGADPAYAELGARLSRLLGDDRFGNEIFEDRVLRQISRVGMKTRRGLITRVDFFELHRHLRMGDFAAAHDRLKALRPASPPPPGRPRRRSGPELILHLGMHKTGSTYLQGQLIHHRAALLRRGLLVPRAGLSDPAAATRAGGFSGHSGLMASLHRDDPAPWDDLSREIAASGASRVLISCENMLIPLHEGRDRLLERLEARLSRFGAVRPIAMVRRPDAQVEAFYREIVGNGQRSGSLTLEAFLVDAAGPLTDLPALFGRFEEIAGRPVALGDFDAAARGGLWPAFRALAGLPGDLPAVPVPRYPTPGRAEIEAARILNTMIPDREARQAMLRDFFRCASADADPGSALAPAARAALLDGFALRSAGFARARGYAPDLDAMRRDLEAEAWRPLAALPRPLVEAAIEARIRFERPGDAPPVAPTGYRRNTDGVLTVRIRPKPWVLRLLARAAAARAGLVAGLVSPARLRPWSGRRAAPPHPSRAGGT